MNEINFLPPSYLKRRARRQRIVWEAMLCIGVLLSLAGAAVMIQMRTSRLQHAAETAEAQTDLVTNQVNERNRLSGRRLELARLLQTQQQLACPIDMSNVLGAIAQVAPETITVRSLHVRSERVLPSPTGARPTTSNAKGAQPASPTYGWTVMRIEIDAIAPDDEQIADFVSRLSDHPVFERVKIRHSREGQFEKFKVRRFRVDMEVPLDRAYECVASGDVRQEVAHAE